jgi:hypothetical protein
MNTSAVSALLAAWFLWWVFGLGAVLAIVFGRRAKREIASSPEPVRGKTMANVAIVIGWLEIAMWIVLILAARDPNFSF